MSTQYRELDEFPEYAVSEDGHVVNLVSAYELKPRPNQYGLIRVGLSRDGQQSNRLLAPLVASAFIEPEREDFDTVIHLDGDRYNCRADNLRWRPRWFAIAFHKQFLRDSMHIDATPIEDVRSGDQYDTPKHAVTSLGILYNDIVLSFTNQSYTFPTMQQWRPRH